MGAGAAQGSRQEVTCLPGGRLRDRRGCRASLRARYRTWRTRRPALGGCEGSTGFLKRGWAALGDNPRSEKVPVLTGAAGAASAHGWLCVAKAGTGHPVHPQHYFVVPALIELAVPT
jgi:hypothetical protein